MTAIPAVSITALCGAGMNPNRHGTHSPRAANSLPRRWGAACHTMPSATHRNPAGMTDSATQRGRNAVNLPPSSRSAFTNKAAAQARHMAIAAPTAETKMRTLPAHRSGRKVLAESDRRRSKRAARAAPRKAIHSVRCCTSTVEPGMPGSLHCREIISAMGSSAISASATALIFELPRSDERYSSRSLRTSSNRSAGIWRPRSLG